MYEVSVHCICSKKKNIYNLHTFCLFKDFFYTSLFRCPEEVTSLRCWATKDEAEVVDDEDSEKEKGVCNIVAMVAPCVSDVDWGSLSFGINPCA